MIYKFSNNNEEAYIESQLGMNELIREVMYFKRRNPTGTLETFIKFQDRTHHETLKVIEVHGIYF